jgi:transposase
MFMLASMFIDTVPNRNSPPAVLLRKSVRRGKKTLKKTLLNLSDWPQEVVAGLDRLLRGEKLASVNDLFAIERSTPHGHVEAILGTIKALGVDRLLASKPSRERDLVVAMVAERLLYPCSKLATTRLWHTTTLAEELNVADADVDELYDALDWLLARQKRIEKKLAKRHLCDGAQALYDVSSSYYEGRTCVLAVRGHDRDGKKGLPIIVYGVMTDAEGRPIAVDVYPGNTGDPTTVPDQVEKLRGAFGLSRIVLVGDRGMLTQTQIDNLKTYPQLGWISALRTGAIRQLAAAGSIQMTLFDRQNLAEIESPEFPGERLMVCFNPPLAEERRRKRDELLAATEKALEKISREVKRRTNTPLGEGEIGVRVGRVINQFKMAKHFTLTIEDNRFEWARNAETIAIEAALDGIYVIRTSEPAERLSAEDTVRSYKNLSHVERAFRTLKGVDIRVRPIRHRTEDHVRAHIFLCLLTYYVEWHMRKAWAPLLFDDEELDADRKTRDPVAPAQPSRSAKKKKTTRRTTDGLPVHSFATLLAALATRTRNRCRTTTGKTTFTFDQISEPTPLQKRAFELLGMCPVRGKSI